MFVWDIVSTSDMVKPAVSDASNISLFRHSLDRLSVSDAIISVE
jgi:hypothetical protein